MKKPTIHTKKGIILYNSLNLNKFSQYTVDELKRNPKEVFVRFDNIICVSTEGMPNNWISVKTNLTDKLFYENRSINNFMKVAETNNHIFQKINSKLAINLSMLKYKSNYSLVELISGDIYKVNRRFRSRLKISLMRLWEE